VNLKLTSGGVAAFAVLLLCGVALAQDKPASGGGGGSNASSSENQFQGGSDAAPAPGFGAAAVTSSDDLITGNSLDAIVASFERNGLKVALGKASDGDPRIESSDPDNPFTVHFYSCTENTDCGVIQFVAGWDLANGIPLAKIEEWNATKLWGQAYRDDDKDPWLAMTVNVRGGVTVANFDDTVDWWRVVSGDFKKHIGWDD